MKTRIIILIAFMALSFGVNAQMTLENSYMVTGNSNLTVVNLANSGYKYQFTDITNNQVKFYNINHSLWKTINITPPVGYTLIGAGSASETLFNSNANVEIICSFYRITPSVAYEIRIIDETGAILSTIPNGIGAYPVFTGTNEWKLIATINPGSGTTAHNIYSLSGTYPTQISKLSEDNMETGNVYPNPAQLQITIPYNLPQGNHKGQIVIYDITGKEILRQDIDNTFGNLHLDIASFSKGIYVYKILTKDNIISSELFMVR